jgi:diguanylate cyclase (GGDEF)-like protein
VKARACLSINEWMTPHQDETHLMAYSAAAMYGGAAFVTVVEGLTPGGPPIAVLPGLLAFVLVPLIAFGGTRLPRAALEPLGPLGAAMIAWSLATGHAWGDGAALYMWPAVWGAHFFGRWGTVRIVASIGVAHGIALACMPGGYGYFDRWIDVMVSVGIVAVVVRVLSERYHGALTRMAEEARVDALTGLLNRRGLAERLSAELSRARRELSSVAVVEFDIDHFKRVNDEHGHAVGDRVLARLGRILRENAREHDVVARIGGEEFVAVLPSTRGHEALVFAERVRHELSSDTPAGLPRITASAGVASELAPLSGRDLEAAADRALYRAKDSGRDCTVVAELGGPEPGVPDGLDVPMVGAAAAAQHAEGR